MEILKESIVPPDGEIEDDNLKDSRLGEGNLRKEELLQGEGT